MYRLIGSGFKAYLVGGAVRDIVLGKKPKDFDVSTDATPRQIRALFRNCRIIGRRFKLAHIFFPDGKIVETSTFRDLNDSADPDEERPRFGPQVARDNRYGTEETDAIRRDLTINGLFYDPSSFSIIDYVGGMNDLRAGIVRIIGNPDERINDDPVRMLRAIRHAVRNHFTIEESCRDSIIKNASLIRECAPARIYEEFKRDLNSGHFCEVLIDLARHQILDQFLPELVRKDGSTFMDNPYLCDALRRGDELFLSSSTASATPLLATIALFATAGVDRKDQLADAFQHESDLCQRLEKCFRSLAVPRREKGNIENLLCLWYRLATSVPSPLRPANLMRHPEYQNLLTLLEMLNIESLNSTLFKLLKLAESAPAQRTGGRNNRHRRRPRRPSRAQTKES